MVLFVEKRHCPRDPGIVLSRQVCTNNTVIHKSSGRIAYDLYRICDFAHSGNDARRRAHGRRGMETQRDRRTTETQQNHGDPTQSPWTGHPQPHPIRPPILPPIRRQTHFTPHPSHPTHVRQSLNPITGHIITIHSINRKLSISTSTSTSRTGWPPCLPIYSQRRTHLVLAGSPPR